MYVCMYVCIYVFVYAAAAMPCIHMSLSLFIYADEEAWNALTRFKSDSFLAWKECKYSDAEALLCHSDCTDFKDPESFAKEILRTVFRLSGRDDVRESNKARVLRIQDKNANAMWNAVRFGYR